MARRGAPEADHIMAATRAIAQQPGTEQNASLRITLARMNLEQAQARSGPYTDEARYREAVALATEAVRLAEGHDPATGAPRATAMVDRAEAALVNRHAATVLRTTGDTLQAAQRERVARFYEVSDEERGAAVLSGFIARQTPGTVEMRSVSVAEQRLEQLRGAPENEPEDADDDRPRYNSVIVNQGTRQARVVKREDIPGEYKAPETETLVTYDERGRRLSRTQPRDVRDPDNPNRTLPPELNRPGVSGGRNAGAGVDVLDLLNDNGPLLADLYHGKSVGRVAERARLEQRVFNERYYVVPPRAEDVPRVLAELERRFPQVREPHVRRQVEQGMREESHAFWNK